MTGHVEADVFVIMYPLDQMVRGGRHYHDHVYIHVSWSLALMIMFPSLFLQATFQRAVLAALRGRNGGSCQCHCTVRAAPCVPDVCLCLFLY